MFTVHLVVFAGAVQPIGEPLRSQFQEGSVGVVQKLMLREHKLVWNSFARTWYEPQYDKYTSPCIMSVFLITLTPPPSLDA